MWKYLEITLKKNFRIKLFYRFVTQIVRSYREQRTSPSTCSNASAAIMWCFCDEDSVNPIHNFFPPHIHSRWEEWRITIETCEEKFYSLLNSILMELWIWQYNNNKNCSRLVEFNFSLFCLLETFPRHFSTCHCWCWENDIKFHKILNCPIHAISHSILFRLNQARYVCDCRLKLSPLSLLIHSLFSLLGCTMSWRI